MSGKIASRPRATRFVSATAAGLLVFGLAPAAEADPLSDLNVQSTLSTATGAVNDLTGTATTAASGTTATRSVAGVSTMTYSGGMNEALRYNDAFFMERATNPFIEDPARTSRRPVKTGIALFTAYSGNFDITLNYAARFNGDFEEHQGGLRFTWKIPPN